MIPKRVTLHCSVSPNGKRYPIEEIKRFHVEQRGWTDVGYHMVFQPDGEVEAGRPLNKIGAHVEGANDGNLGFCLIGTDKFTMRQFDSLRYKLDSVRMIYDIPPWEIWAHCQFESAVRQGKTCPNIPINVVLSWYIGNYHKALFPYLLPDHGEGF